MSLTEPQLDALREVANIGSGNASTALAATIGRDVDINVPKALVLSMGDAVAAMGDPEQATTGILLGVVGDVEGAVLLLMEPAHAQVLYGVFGLEPDTEMADSALQEIGNIVGTAYLNALADLSSLDLEPTPPAVVTDMLGAIVSSVIAGQPLADDRVVFMDSKLKLEGDDDCAVSFVLVPAPHAIDRLLEALGVS